MFDFQHSYAMMESEAGQGCVLRLYGPEKEHKQHILYSRRNPVMNFEAIKQAARRYEADMTKFLRDMIAIPSESCGE